jgi:hypothetical protein
VQPLHKIRTFAERFNPGGGGVEVFDGSLAFVRVLRTEAIKTACVMSWKSAARCLSVRD